MKFRSILLRRSRRGLFALVSFALVMAAASTTAFAQDMEVHVLDRGVKDYHVVTQGDTLYGLSERYLGDVYEWPRLWSYNPHITNPHWIYPSDIVYLRPAPPGKEPAAMSPRARRGGSSQPMEYHLAVGGFIEPKVIPYVGRIVASPKQANLLSELDTVWVGFGARGYTKREVDELDEKSRTKLEEPQELKVGSRFAVVRKVGQINDEDDEDKILGHKYRVLGTLRVTEIKSKPYLHVAKITQSWQEMERGDLLVPYERQIKKVTPFRADRNMVAKIVDTVESVRLLGEFAYVYINRGAKDRLRSGFRFFVYQREEGLLPLDKAEDEEIPYQRVGQVMVLDVREHYSTGLIIDSSKEIKVGDRLEMYEGN